MVMGPLARIVAQVAMVAGGAIARSFAQAYKEAAQKAAANPQARSVMWRRMGIEEARSVLDVPPTATVEEITARFSRLKEINQKSESSPGSPYLVKKITNAEVVLREFAEAEAQKKTAEETVKNAAKNDFPGKPPGA